MRSLRLVPGLTAILVSLACSEPATLPSVADSELTGDSDFETAELRVGHVRVRDVRVPSGYSLVDMNDQGDLLLGAAWLPNGRKRPLALPFTGRSINNHRQILGPGRAIYRAGRVTELPDPCIPFTVTLTTVNGTDLTVEDVVFNCSYHPVEVSALAENGDAIAAYRQDAPGTALSPHRFFKVWRADAHDWQTVVDFGSSEGGHIDAAISDTGLLAVRVSTFPWHSISFVNNGNGLLVDGICTTETPPPFSDPQAIPRAVNDAGEAVGLINCEQVGVEVTGVRWSRAGAPTRLGGTAWIIDNAGNAAGVRESDGHGVVWLADGSVIDLSAAVGNQPVSVRKFLRRGQVFGFAGAQPMVWRFGFADATS